MVELIGGTAKQLLWVVTNQIFDSELKKKKEKHVGKRNQRNAGRGSRGSVQKVNQIHTFRW